MRRPPTVPGTITGSPTPSADRGSAAEHLHDPVEVTVKSKTQTAENITQRYFQVSYPRKMDALTRLLEVEQGDAPGGRVVGHARRAEVAVDGAAATST
mgnify:CR=1 FL=1